MFDWSQTDLALHNMTLELTPAQRAEMEFFANMEPKAEVRPGLRRLIAAGLVRLALALDPARPAALPR